MYVLQKQELKKSFSLFISQTTRPEMDEPGDQRLVTRVGKSYLKVSGVGEQLLISQCLHKKTEIKHIWRTLCQHVSDLGSER